jgi:hypothetical protein
MRIKGISSIVFAAIVGMAGPVWADSTFKVKAEGTFLIKHDMVVIPFTWKGTNLFEGKKAMDDARDVASKKEAAIIAYFRDNGLAQAIDFDTSFEPVPEVEDHQVIGYRAGVRGQLKVLYVNTKKDAIASGLKDKLGVKISDLDRDVSQAARVSETTLDGLWASVFANGTSEARAMAKAAGCSLDGDVDADSTGYQGGGHLGPGAARAAMAAPQAEGVVTREEKKDTGVMLRKSAVLVYHATGCKPRS